MPSESLPCVQPFRDTNPPKRAWEINAPWSTPKPRPGFAIKTVEIQITSWANRERTSVRSNRLRYCR